jgi:receptor expression-enhancing protein 1/2/3/4
MYWIVLSLLLFVESLFSFILFWVPFYSWIRLFLSFYLIMPGSQGATYLYIEHVEPFLHEHEREIERFIAEAHDKAKKAGLAYAKQAIEWVKVNVIGMPPRPPTPPSSRQGSGSYTQNLLSRFAMPAARQPTADFSSLVSQALSSATTLFSNRDDQVRDLADSGVLLPPELRDARPEEQNSYINTQRERLRLLLQAFDREAFFMASETDRPAEPGSRDRLAKSRSELDFDRIDPEEVPRPSGSRQTSSANAWMPWKWGGSGDRPRSARTNSDSEEEEEDRRKYRDERGDRYGERDRRNDRWEDRAFVDPRDVRSERRRRREYEDD